ncbi:hypothetical protein ATERTT37_005526 [Aspergillus terreus]
MAIPGTVRAARRGFHPAPALWGIKSQVLKDVGEGITEVQIIQWYVEEGARIEEWKPLCQYQSDKAVDDALCDIEVDDAKYPDEHPPVQQAPSQPTPAPSTPPQTEVREDPVDAAPLVKDVVSPTPKSRYATLATPAVRGMLKTLNVDIQDVQGTGKDGRVLKEDIQRFVAARDSPSAAQPESPQTETAVNLTPIQSQMFKTMTRSLSIPHFLYTDELNINNITALRKKLASDAKDPIKLTFLSFVVKAVSLALSEYPLLNAKVDMSNPDKPQLIMRPRHNIGVAMDTPQGLIVPNVKDVANRSILEVAAEISRLSALGKEGKFTPADLSGGTITVSNIGNIGGTYVGPVIVPNEVAILGIDYFETNYPEGLGDAIVQEIPQDPQMYQEWLTYMRAAYSKLAQQYETQCLPVNGRKDTVTERRATSFLAVDDRLEFTPTQARISDVNFWCIEWIYTLDLDRELFGVDNSIYFQLSKVPHDDSWIKYLGEDKHGRRVFTKRTPKEIIGTVEWKPQVIIKSKIRFKELDVKTVCLESLTPPSSDVPTHREAFLLSVFTAMNTAFKGFLDEHIIQWKADDFCFREVAFALLSLAAGEVTFVNPSSLNRNYKSEGYYLIPDRGPQNEQGKLFTTWDAYQATVLRNLPP